MEKATFTRIDQMTREDWELIETQEREQSKSLPDRLLAELHRLDEGEQPYAVSRLKHCLQTATRALRDGASEEMIVAALIHDIGDPMALYNHAEFAAALIKPYVSEKVHWIICNHDVFQGHYYWDVIGLDKNAREKYRDHPWFEECEAFCFKWDCPSFDPEYDTLPLSHFEPMLRRIFSAPPYSHRKQEYTVAL
ncbi:HD domain-containing protein [Pseudomonas sp. SCB32]|uniref:HD domain-containing protein n=1 Tax=Pseudomonas sp. SCB32 TaxID=2653853 RepID=UPI0012649319|nr:inositol oxygenase family protein [Pseudomonas sp. SCB32]